ncbi:MAG: putative RNA methyltransferase [Cyclobacteriaceae bacterium]|nr:MAG: putative RNA methyltransferase [Cyclobacteriaceae bacterium]
MSRKLKNQIVNNITIEDAASDGKCVARWNNRVIFVGGVAPGDVVDIRITRKKRNYLEAVPEHFHHRSELRADPFCHHFGTCGGCKWQHIDYKHQLEFKRKQVIDSLERIGRLSLPEVNQTLASPDTRFYRNRLEFTFSNKRWLEPEEIQSDVTFNRNGVGFHKPGLYDKIVDIQHCSLQDEPSNTIRNSVRAFAFKHDLNFFDIQKKQGFLRNLIIRNSSIGELMVILQVAEDRAELGKILDHLRESFPQITSLQYVINSKGNETFFDLPVQLHSGVEFITESMGDLQFRIGPKSFYQTNSRQAYLMYQLVRDFAGLFGKEIVYDLYTGTGTIALFLASLARTVVGIEQVPEAIEDARVNAGINDIANSYFYAGDTRELLSSELITRHGTPDVLITDPPRSGMHQEVVEKIIRISPKKIIYVSCNPATQARDIALLVENYQIMAVQPVDMFPHTHHVESVVLLEIKSDD